MVRVLSLIDLNDNMRSLLEMARAQSSAHVPPHEFVERSPKEMISVNDVLDVLKGEFDVLVLPLSLPNYNALRIAEYAHRIHGALRTVLITRSTDVDQDACRALFDVCFFTDPLLAMLSPAWGDAFRSNAPKRWLTAQEAERHIETILGSAGCFLAGNTFGGRHPEQARRSTLRDYDAAAAVQSGDWLAAAAHEHLKWPGAVPPAMQFFVGSLYMGDNFHIQGSTIGSVGRNSVSGEVIVNQPPAQAGHALDPQVLTAQLAELRRMMRAESVDAAHDVSVGHVAAAEAAVSAGQHARALEHLKAAGKWALDVATKIGTAVAADAIKNALK